MKIRAIQWAAVDNYLKLVRLPFDTAIKMSPDVGAGVKPTAKAAVDGADAVIRAIVANVLGDPVSVDDAGRQVRHGHSGERVDARGHGSDSHPSRHSNEQRPPASEQRGRTRREAPPTGEPAAAAERPTAVAASGVVPSAPRAVPRGRVRAAAISGTARRTAGNGTRRSARDAVTADKPAPPESADRVSPEPSHEEIAARAYELYRHGVPGDAGTHWQAAKRELASRT